LKPVVSSRRKSVGFIRRPGSDISELTKEQLKRMCRVGWPVRPPGGEAIDGDPPVAASFGCAERGAARWRSSLLDLMNCWRKWRRRRRDGVADPQTLDTVSFRPLSSFYPLV
jgi:hypothetical protein